MDEIKLGDKVKDTVTGFKGIAVGCTEWLNGCNRVIIQPEGLNKDGETYKPETFDEPQVEVIAPKKTKKRKSTTGGPISKVAMKKY